MHIFLIALIAIQVTVICSEQHVIPQNLRCPSWNYVLISPASEKRIRPPHVPAHVVLLLPGEYTTTSIMDVLDQGPSIVQEYVEIIGLGTAPRAVNLIAQQDPRLHIEPRSPHQIVRVRNLSFTGNFPGPLIVVGTAQDADSQKDLELEFDRVHFDSRGSVVCARNLSEKSRAV